jgi:hypothetical protein
MPTVKPQELKSIKTLELQPDKMSSKIQLIIAMDLAGYNGNAIAEAVDLCISRVSIIRNSPLYLQERERKWAELQSQVVDKKSDKIVAGDPVENKIKDLALRAVGKYETLLGEAKSEFVQKATADSILDRAGYKAKTDKTVVSVEVTEKMADRFERVLGRSTEGSVTRTTTVTKES